MNPASKIEQRHTDLACKIINAYFYPYIPKTLLHENAIAKTAQLLADFELERLAEARKTLRLARAWMRKDSGKEVFAVIDAFLASAEKEHNGMSNDTEYASWP